MRKTTVRQKIILLIACAAVLVCIGVLFAYTNSGYHHDTRNLKHQSYDTVFLSMYPIDNFAEEDYLHFRSMTLIKTQTVARNLSQLTHFVKTAANSSNPVGTIYLGIRPELISSDKLMKLASAYPDIAFEVITASPCADYWSGLSQSEYENTLNAYEKLLRQSVEVDNLRCYLYSDQEWFISNSGLYDDTFTVNTEGAFFIMAHSDFLQQFYVTTDNLETRLSDLNTITCAIRSEENPHTSISGDTCEFIFFGDSFFGNFTGALSIPGVVESLTHAPVYNCGYGGNSAALGAEDCISLPGIVDAFYSGDLSKVPSDEQVYLGLSEYLSSSHTETADSAAHGKQIFVINYGLNDYFKGYPISSADSYDIHSYEGAIRSAVATIRHNSPDARILLCVPTYTPFSTEESEASEYELLDYVQAVQELSAELNVTLVDNYHALGIDNSNYMEHLTDTIHPNEKTRYRIAQNILSAIE